MTHGPHGHRPAVAHRLTRWTVIALAWTLFGLFMGWQSYTEYLRAGRPISWEISFFREMVYSYLWLMLTPVVLWLWGKFPIGGARFVRNTLLHFLLSLGVSFLHKFAFHSIVLWYEAGPGSPFALSEVLRGALTYLDYGVILYWVLLLIRSSFEYYQKYREHEVRASRLEAQVARAELQALKMQVHPHFLFNTLNAISVLVQKNPESARQMISKLSELLRMTLETGEKQEVPLRKELEILNHYLEIEQTRFEDRLTVRMDIPVDTLDIQVPGLILQPLVENAMRHGVAMQRGSALVEVSARCLDGMLQLQVRDNGPGAGTIKDGIGFSNIRNRLRQMYGGQQCFTAGSDPEGGFLATVSLPLRTPPVTPREE